MTSACVKAVVLGHMVDPRTVWAYPMYEEGGQHHRILRIEKQIAELHSQAVTELSPTGISVAVRRSPGSEVWHRGRLDQLSMYGKQLLATVFLIDYGEVIETMRVEACVRHMPAGVGEEPPLAFQILLAGLAPVSMDLDFMLGQEVMEVTPQRGWDAAAWREVEKQIQEVKAKGYAEVRDWMVDHRGRYHGQLYLVEEDGKERISLNQFLVEKEFAVKSQWQLENDMYEAVADYSENIKEFRAMDIRGKDEEFESLDDFKEENECNVAFGESEIVDEPLPASTLSSLDYVCSIGRGSCWNKKLQEGTGTAGATRDSDHPQSRQDKAKEFLNKLKKKKVVPSKAETTEEFWSVVRGKSRHNDGDTSASHLLPGGVFIGRHHEKVLANIQAENKLDQKKKFERFVAAGKEDFD